MHDIGKALRSCLTEHKIKDALVDRYGYAGDAGFYYLLPQAVVQPDCEEDIRILFRFSREHGIPLTFRAGGTSLSGQSITDGILVDISKHWKRVAPFDEGRKVKVQPGVIGGHVNHALQPFSRKIGPDPASIGAALMGGILSNNSSGMCCGVAYNSYHTVQSIRFILPNGNAYDTSVTEDYERFLEKDRALYDGLLALQQRVRSNAVMVAKIRSKYRIKNTVGYSINAFLDYDHPLDVLSRLLIGGEGTLAFISEAVLETIPDKSHKSTAILFFESPVAAANAVPALKDTDADALEFMDRPALHSVEDMPFCPAMIRDLPEGTTGILCEYQGADEEELKRKLERAVPVIGRLPVTHKLDFTRDAYEQAKLWKMRKGMYPSVAAVRAKGTTAMLEDVAVPIQNLGKAVTDLQDLFRKYGYHNAIIFGHAKEGNLHFLVTQPVNTSDEIDVFERFNEELADIIIRRYDGSLKAEHGTGRQIAPFVKDEWGEDAYRVMQDLKQLLDPRNLLNPGVIINADDRCHLKNMKTMPVVEEEVDRCVECGYCENRCPSRNYTTTPRQRIQIRRSLQRLKSSGNIAEHDALLDQYQFAGMDTCAVDGMCATDCPVSINTGDLIKRLRRENHSAFANRVALQVSKNFSLVERMVRFGLRSGNAINAVTGRHTMRKITGAFKKVAPSFPLWLDSISQPVKIRPSLPAKTDIVYFPSCITRMMGADKEDRTPIDEVIRQLCEKAGLGLFVANQTGGVCCGQLFSSKGFMPAYRHTANLAIENLWKWTDGGKAPVLMDVTSCTHSLQTSYPHLSDQNKKIFAQLNFIDSIDFAADYLLPRLAVVQKKDVAVFHPVCTTYKMNLGQKLEAIGRACAHKTDIPFLSGCCGMAGDRGFYYPRLTASATHDEAAEVLACDHESVNKGYYSSGKTCEMAMREATGKNYQSVLYLLKDTIASGL